MIALFFINCNICNAKRLPTYHRGEVAVEPQDIKLDRTIRFTSSSWRSHASKIANDRMVRQFINQLKHSNSNTGQSSRKSNFHNPAFRSFERKTKIINRPITSDN